MIILDAIILFYKRSKILMKKNVTGSKIQEIRANKKITQEEMVARLQSYGFDISRSSYAKIESHIRQVKDLELQFIAKALNVEVGKLFE